MFIENHIRSTTVVKVRQLENTIDFCFQILMKNISIHTKNETFCCLVTNSPKIDFSYSESEERVQKLCKCFDEKNVKSIETYNDLKYFSYKM